MNCRILSALCWIALVWAIPALTATPAEIPGLVAWYDAGSLALNDGDPVREWPDLQGGHDLLDERDGVPALFRKDQIHGRPAVQVQNANSHKVTNPFTLGAHTIFLVLAAEGEGKALFRADGERSVGVLLRDDPGRDVLQYSGARPGLVVRYGTRSATGSGFHLTVLGREEGQLRAFVDGEDVSSGDPHTAPLGVGRFFHLRHTNYVKSDGEGLRIAEMLFYDRFLTPAERAAVTTHLTGKYGLQLAEAAEPAAAPRAVPLGLPLAQLTTKAEIDVNGGGAAVPWDVPLELDPPFAHDPVEHPSRLYWTADEVRVRLSASLPLVAEEDGPDVRLLFRRNGSEFLRGEGRSGRILGGSGSVRAEVITRLRRGDYVEVVTVPIGAPGVVKIVQEAAVFIAEAK